MHYKLSTRDGNVYLVSVDPFDTYEDTFPQTTIKLYRYDGSTCLATVDGKSVALVPRSQMVDLIEAVNAVVLGK